MRVSGAEECSSLWAYWRRWQWQDPVRRFRGVEESAKTFVGQGENQKGLPVYPRFYPFDSRGEVHVGQVVRGQVVVRMMRQPPSQQEKATQGPALCQRLAHQPHPQTVRCLGSKRAGRCEQLAAVRPFRLVSHLLEVVHRPPRVQTPGSSRATALSLHFLWAIHLEATRRALPCRQKERRTRKS